MNTIKHLMILLSAAVLTFIAPSAHAQREQAPELKITGLEALSFYGKQPLLNANGEIKGRYHAVPSEEDRTIIRYKVELGENTFTIDPYSFLWYDEQGHHLITFGVEPEIHTMGFLHFKIFDVEGRFISEQKHVADFPFAATVTLQGELVVLGNNPTSEDPATIYLQRYTALGQRNLNVPIGNVLPKELFSSPNGMHYAVYFTDISGEGGMQAIVRIYNSSGALVAQHNPRSLGDLQFISDNEFIIAGNGYWTLFEIEDGLTPKATGTLENFPMSPFGITPIPASNAVAIVSPANPESNQGLILQVYDLATGNQIDKKELPGSSAYVPYRKLVVLPDGELRLYAGNQVHKLKFQR